MLSFLLCNLIPFSIHFIISEDGISSIVWYFFSNDFLKKSISSEENSGAIKVGSVAFIISCFLFSNISLSSEKFLINSLDLLMRKASSKSILYCSNTSSIVSVAFFRFMLALPFLLVCILSICSRSDSLFLLHVVSSASTSFICDCKIEICFAILASFSLNETLTPLIPVPLGSNKTFCM